MDRSECFADSFRPLYGPRGRGADECVVMEENERLGDCRALWIMLSNSSKTMSIGGMTQMPICEPITASSNAADADESRVWMGQSWKDRDSIATNFALVRT